MSVFEVADRLVDLCRQGRFLECGETLWADDVVSIEPFTGEMAHLQGKDAVRAKGEWWVANHEVHSVEVDEPFFCGDSFIVRFRFDMTENATGNRRTLEEFGLYEVRDGRIARESFFVPAAYFGR